MLKKRNTKFRKVDLAVIILCLIGSISCGIGFLGEYNRTLTKLNEEPIATIVFKKRTAQRKFIDRVIWDRLRLSSVLYNGDIIRTIEFSEAMLTFKDEVTNLEMDQNTMIQIFWDDVEGARIEFTSGNLGVASQTGDVVVSTGSSKVVVRGESRLNKNEKGFNLSVLRGEANFDNEKLEEGKMLSLDEKGQVDLRPAIFVTSFGPSARVRGAESGTTPVVFSWNTSNFTSDTYVIVEIARDSGFRRIIANNDARGVTTASVSVENGSYWWRAYPASAGSRRPANDVYPSGTLEVAAPKTQIAVVSPSAQIPEPPTPPPPAPTPRPAPAPRPAPVPTRQEPAPTQPVPEPAPQPEPVPEPQPQPQPEPRPVPQQPVEQPSQQPEITEPQERDLLRVAERSTVINTIPSDSYVIYTEQIRNTPSVHFLWEGKAEAYSFALYNSNGETIIPPTRTNGTTFILDNPGILKDGDYIWQVYELPSADDLPGAANRLHVKNEQLKIRELPTMEPGELYGNE